MPACTHVDQVGRPVTPGADGCQECLQRGERWVHLRLCLSCGHVGCCDSSRNRHATRHFRATGHPIAASAEPREDWAWCFADQLIVQCEQGPRPAAPHHPRSPR
ncbi:putative UBP type Zn finger protein [Streptacidiphilus sp. MAP12-16]|uniref:ubiquitin carboxyl-terminal hydrolase 14 n=1 Tax=Streptacidiphilus sp. MAP12-16 TaxID=3156300 RepID=UPI003518C269